MTETVTISQLYIHPIKSFPGLSVNSLTLDSLGAINDRRYMLVDENGKFITQRQYASLALIELKQHDQGWQIRFPECEPKLLPFAGTIHSERQVTIWNDSCKAFDQGDEWAAWFSDKLDKPVRLVYTPENINRRVDPDYCPENRHVSFTDGFPLLVTSESSLEAINEELKQPITMQRFRPNIVITGADAFAEDNWYALKSENNEFQLVKPCSRCVIPTINLQTAGKEKAVWQALQQLRQADDGKIYFGQNAIHQHEGELHVGDQLLINPGLS